MPSLPSIFDLCSPRLEVLTGDLPDALFAADLWEVIENTAHDDYRLPDRFFANSYSTESLARLLKDVGERLAGAGDATPVFRLETGFGGGKTHSLIAAVHLAREGANLQSSLLDFGLTRLPEPGQTRVAAFVGDQSDPQQGLLRTESGEQFRTYTPWGEIAYRLGGRAAYEEVRINDEQGGAPSRQALERVFGDGPVLVLIDELVLFLARALALPADHPRHHVVYQLPTFLQTLFTLASQRPKTSVIFTLPTEQDANRRVTAEFRQLIPQVLEAVDEMAQTAGRQVLNLTPTQSHERAAVLGRRLFESVDRRKAADIATAYQKYYAEQREAGVDIESRAFERDYGQQIANSYPFHPEMIRLFSVRLAEINEFQATRGALRLIARTIRAVWNDKRRWKGTLLLHPFHVDLARPELQDELLARLDRLAFRPALEEDVVGSEGGTHAALVEEGWPVKAATESAVTVLLHSLPEGSRGLTPAEVALAVGRPGYDLAYVRRGLDETERRGWYMYTEGGRYFFRARASVNKRFQERAREVQPGEIREQLDQWIEEVFAGFENFQVVLFPQDQTALPDVADRLRLVVVHYDKEAGFVGSGNRLDFTRRLYETKGLDRLPRTYKNNLVFLLAEGNRVDGLKDTVRTLIAWERVRRDLEAEQRSLADGQSQEYRVLRESARRGGAGVPSEFMALENDLATVMEKLGPQELSVRTRLLDAYRVLAFPPSGGQDAYAALFDPAAGRPPLECYRVDFGEMPQTGRLRRAAPGREPAAETPILEALRQNNKLVPAPQSDNPVVLAPNVLRQAPVWQSGERKLSTQEVWERLRKNPELPMLLRAADLLPTLRAGLTDAADPLWYYYDADEKRSYVRETASELSPILSSSHFLYEIRAAVQDNIIPVRQVAPADLWNKLWPRESGERVPSLSVDRFWTAARASVHFPVLPSREVLWRSLQEGARENRWVLYLPALDKAIGAQEMEEWPGTPRFEPGVEVWQYQAALDAGWYPRRATSPQAAEALSSAALKRKCWPEGTPELPTEDLERFARGVWADVSRGQLELALQDGIRAGLWGAWHKGEPEAFILAGDAAPEPVRISAEWSLVQLGSTLARELEGLRPGRGPQPAVSSGTPREALTASWDALRTHRNAEVGALRLTAGDRATFDNTLLATWADRPTNALSEAHVHAEGAREIEGRRESLSLEFTGRFEEVRALLAPVWPFARGGQLNLQITLTLTFEQPVPLDDAVLNTYRMALMNANQGQLEVEVIPVRRQRSA